MSDAKKKNSFNKIMKIVLFVILILSIFPAIVSYSNWSAENEAKALCDDIEIGLNVSPVITKFEKKIGKKNTLHYEFDEGNGHRFLFPGFMFDKAQCTVQLNKNGKIISKYSEMLYD